MRALFLVPIAACVAASPAMAVNWTFLEYSPSNHFTETDWQALRQAGRDALDNAADGEKRIWSNPESDANGSVRPLSTYQADGTTCRRTEVVNAAKSTSASTRFDFCRQPDGTWKIAPARRPAKDPAKAAE